MLNSIIILISIFKRIINNLLSIIIIILLIIILFAINYYPIRFGLATLLKTHTHIQINETVSYKCWTEIK